MTKRSRNLIISWPFFFDISHTFHIFANMTTYNTSIGNINLHSMSTTQYQRGDIIRGKDKRSEPIIVTQVFPDKNILYGVGSYMRTPVALSLDDVRKDYVLVRRTGSKSSLAEAIDFANNEIAAEPPKVELLTDNLKKGDVITHKTNKDWIPDEVLNVDHVANTVYIRDTTDNNTRGIYPFEHVNSNMTIIGSAEDFPPKKHILTIKETKSVEVFHAHYNDTKRDKRYIRYCERMGRDYPKTKEFVNRDTTSMDYTELLTWLQKSLTDDEINKLKHDL